MKQTQYELSERILLTKGSLKTIGEKLGISKAYVSMLKKVRADGAAQVIDYWKSGELPWTLARALSNLPRKEQLPILRQYIRGSRDKTRLEKQAALYEALDEIKGKRGITLSTPKLEKVRASARKQFQDDECQIDNGKIIEVEDGYWVPAHLWVEKEGKLMKWQNIRTGITVGNVEVLGPIGPHKSGRNSYFRWDVRCTLCSNEYGARAHNIAKETARCMMCRKIELDGKDKA